MEIGYSQEKEPDWPDDVNSSAEVNRRSKKNLQMIKKRIEEGYYFQPEIIDVLADILIKRPEINIIAEE